MERKFKLSDRKTADQNYTGAPRGRIVVGGIYPRNRSLDRIPVAYAHAVKKAGGTPVVYSTFALAPGEEPPKGLEVHTKMDPHRSVLPEDAIGLVLPGGGDIDPALYGHEPHPRTRNVSKRRDSFEITMLQQALERDLPVLAICRGMQLLNIHLGGTLDQHLADVGGRLEHDRDRPRAEPAHGGRFKEGTLLADVLGTQAEVNSHHHQGLDEVSPQLEEIGWAEDGVLEGVVMPEKSWVFGVQWHPEVMAPVHPSQLKLFAKFIEATRDYAARQTPARSAQKPSQDFAEARPA